MTLIKKPALTISRMVSSFEPNTTALGGVATGSIKAHEAVNNSSSHQFNNLVHQLSINY